jgi:hypothetical protein
MYGRYHSYILQVTYFYGELYFLACETADNIPTLKLSLSHDTNMTARYQ